MSYHFKHGLKNYGFGQIPLPPVYLNNKWLCDQGSKPDVSATGTQQAYCCPSGWTISTYNDPAPCRSEQDLYDCGPIPKGASRATAVCCNRAMQWFAKDPTGADPCADFNLKASDILAPDITPAQVAAQDQIFTPTMMLVGGAALAMMVILSVVVDDD